MKSLCGRVVLLFAVFLPVAPSVARPGPTTEPLTAVLGAQTREIALLRDELEGRKERRFLGIPFWEGRIAGRRAVVAKMGSGKVNATVVATLLVEHFDPREVIVTGIAGGLNPRLGPGDLVIARKTVQHDMCRLYDGRVEYRGARNPVHGVRGPVFLAPPAHLLEIAQRAARRTRFTPIPYRDRASSPRAVRVITGVVATGDAFVASKAKRKQLREDLGADAVEMEGAAVAQVCYTFGVPCLVIRSLSDRADEAAVVDLESFADIAAENSARLVREILRELAEERGQPSADRTSGH